MDEETIRNMCIYIYMKTYSSIEVHDSDHDKVMIWKQFRFFKSYSFKYHVALIQSIPECNVAELIIGKKTKACETITLTRPNSFHHFGYQYYIENATRNLQTKMHCLANRTNDRIDMYVSMYEYCTYSKTNVNVECPSLQEYQHNWFNICITLYWRLDTCVLIDLKEFV